MPGLRVTPDEDRGASLGLLFLDTTRREQSRAWFARRQTPLPLQGGRSRK
jgi:hypothetical protein